MLGFDAADIFEIRGYRRPAHGELLPVRVAGPAIRSPTSGSTCACGPWRCCVHPEPAGPIRLGTARGGRELTASIAWDVELRPGTSTELGWMLRR